MGTGTSVLLVWRLWVAHACYWAAGYVKYSFMLFWNILMYKVIMPVWKRMRSVLMVMLNFAWEIVHAALSKVSKIVWSKAKSVYLTIWTGILERLPSTIHKSINLVWQGCRRFSRRTFDAIVTRILSVFHLQWILDISMG